MDFLLLAKNGKNDWWRVVLFILSVAAAVIVATLVTDNLSFDTEDELATDTFIEGLAFLIVLIGVAIAIRLIHRRSFSSLNGPVRAGEFVEGVVVWGILVILGSLINQQEQWQTFLQRDLDFSFIGILLGVVLCIGIQSYTEEVVFRGYLFQTLSLKVRNLYVTIIICSTIFGVLHGADGLAAIIGTTAFGCLACYIVLRRNNLSFVAGVHMIHNFFFVYVFAGSGTTVDDDNFFKFDAVEYAIYFTQSLVLFLYIRLKGTALLGR